MRLGEQNAGLRVITSRLAVKEVAGFAPEKCRKLDLGGAHGGGGGGAAPGAGGDGDGGGVAGGGAGVPGAQPGARPAGL